MEWNIQNRNKVFFLICEILKNTTLVCKSFFSELKFRDCLTLEQHRLPLSRSVPNNFLCPAPGSILIQKKATL